MPKTKLNADELQEELREDIELMLGASYAYDEGQEAQAKVLAATLRLLLHDTGNSTSLLRLLNLTTQDAKFNKKNIRFFNTSPDVNPRNLLPHQGLVTTRITNGGASHVAPLDDFPPGVVKDVELSFDAWWEQRVVFKDLHGNTFTRRDLVLAKSNKIGLAHISEDIKEALYNLLKKHSTSGKFVIEKNGVVIREEDPSNSAASTAVRQIAHEVLKTLYQVVPECFPEPYVTPKLHERTT